MVLSGKPFNSFNLSTVVLYIREMAHKVCLTSTVWYCAPAVVAGAGFTVVVVVAGLPAGGACGFVDVVVGFPAGGACGFFVGVVLGRVVEGRDGVDGYVFVDGYVLDGYVFVDG
jgi:hypothetical protein